jgi:branched-chain amino acid transport system permease protein
MQSLFASRTPNWGADRLGAAVLQPGQSFPLRVRAAECQFRLRAVFQNREAAALRGVNVRAIYRLSFVLGSVIIFLGGILFALAYSYDLTVAWTMSITAFAIMIIGGPGSVIGALVIGMTFGFTQAIVSIFASPTAATFSYLGAMLLILLFRPSGLFKR